MEEAEPEDLKVVFFTTGIEVCEAVKRGWMGFGLRLEVLDDVVPFDLPHQSNVEIRDGASAGADSVGGSPVHKGNQMCPNYGCLTLEDQHLHSSEVMFLLRRRGSELFLLQEVQPEHQRTLFWSDGQIWTQLVSVS